MKIFIAGTDTDVGKTYITSCLSALLLQKGLHVGVIKWAGTGGAKNNPDIEYIVEQAARANLGPGSRLSVSCPFNFSFPASPHLAATLEGKQIEPGLILEETEKMEKACDIVLIEGVGGLMVPLTLDLLLVDLLEKASCPVALVARSGLGTINHTLLSAEALKKRKIGLMAVVMNSIGLGAEPDSTDEKIVDDNCKTIAKLTGTNIYGPVPYTQDPLHKDVTNCLEPLVTQILEET